MIRKLLIFIVVILLLFLLYPTKNLTIVEATLESCSASVTPTSASTAIVQNFEFTITNGGSNPVQYFKISAPSASYEIQGGSLGGWEVTRTGSYLQIYGGSIAPGSSVILSIPVQIGNNEESAATWTVEANDELSTSGATNCSGSLSTAIIGTNDINPPVISEVAINDLTATSVKIDWVTDEASTSLVDYGLTQNFGLNKTETNMVTTHSIPLTGLTPNTTYFFVVGSTDGAGNIRYGEVITFTTASALLITSAPTARAITATSTPTPTRTITPTPTIIYRDTTPPLVTINTDLSKPFEVAPEISGAASENHSILTEIVYSADGGQNWLPVQFIEKPSTAATSFKFTPQIFEDGNYTVSVRAMDADGNKGLSKSYTIVIDRLPPSVGGNLLALGPQILQPENSGVIVNMVGLQQRIVMSAVGGPTAIDLLVSGRKTPLIYSAETSLWYGFLSFDSAGLYQLSAQAVDGAGNRTERNLNPILVVESGRVIEASSGKALTSGDITIHYQEPQSKVWTIWDAEAFGQVNPQKLSETGTYEFFLPSGTYYLQVNSPGYNTLTSQIFVIEKPTPLNATFKLKEAKHITIGPFTLSWPDFSSDRAEVLLFSPAMPQGLENSILGKDAPGIILPTTDNKEFNLMALRGQPAVVSFISTWSPPAIEQISVIDQAVNLKNVKAAVISSQETASKVSVFRKRGGYQLPVLVDKDGTLVETYGITSLPSHFFLDRNGKVIVTKVGVLSVDEIERILGEIP